MKWTVSLVPDRENREPRLSVVRFRRSARPSDEIQMEPLPGPSNANRNEPVPGPSNQIQMEALPGPSSENRIEPLPGPNNGNRNEPSPGPSSRSSAMRTTVSLVPDREKREPRLSVVRFRRSARPSDEIQMEPLPGPSSEYRIESSPVPSNENQSGSSALQSYENPTGSSHDAQKRARGFKTFLNTVKEFCTNTTVHGFRYFTEPKRHWMERVWWAITVIASIALCSFMIHNMWVKWHEHPTIVSFDDKLTPIDQIPFPAVTICPTKKFLKEKVNIAKIRATLNGAFKANQSAFSDLSAKELSQMNAILQICSSPHSFPADLDIPSSPSIYETIKDIGGRKKLLTDYDTSWKSYEHIFELMQIFTVDGLCYTFNSLNSHQIYADGIAPELLTVRDNPNATHWNREDGYRTNIDENDSYPYRSFSSNINFGWIVAFLTLLDDSHELCSPYAAGLHLSLHAPDELPQTRNNFIHIPLEQMVYILVTPNMMTTSNDLRSYDPHERGCYFQSERKLRFFRSYSEQKCQLECLTDFTRNECGCVHFSMPRVESTKVCTISDMECYLEAKRQFDKHLMAKRCDCLPDCTSISYSTEVSQAPYLHYLDEKRPEKQKFNFSRTGFPMQSKFVMAFKEDHFILINRSESSTMWDILSNCGGLLGLFMGISVLSIVEMIYYFTLRLWVNWRQQNKVYPIVQTEAQAQAQAEAETETTDPPISQNIVEDYCSNTTVHGFYYLTEPKRHRVERVWWAIAVAASIIICGIIIQRIWTNWNENPVIVSFDDEVTSIGEIPFPTVTICPTKKFIMQNVDADKLATTADQLVAAGHSTLDSFSLEEISQLDAIIQTIGLLPNFPPNFTIPSNTLIYDAMRNITLEANSTIQYVNWLNRLNQFKFNPLFTGYGLCYTFNSLNSRDIYSDVVEPELLTVRDNPNATHWNREDGYQSSVQESDQFPFRVFASDALSVRLGIVLDYYYETLVKIPAGFSILLHPPDEIPQTENSAFLIPPEHDAWISIRPETITTSNGLRSYSPHARGCYYQSERPLHFFKKYTQQNCQLECMTNFTTKESGCAYFSFPRVKNTRICTMVDFKRFNAAAIKFQVEFLVKQCDCLPDCSSIVYHAEVSQVPYHHNDAEMKKLKESYKHLGYLSHSKLSISFKENRFISVKRSESSTMWDFISSCGGLLGLFMGVSLISVVELVYYFTLRWGVNWWQRKADRPNEPDRFHRSYYAILKTRWEKLKEHKRNCGAFIRNQWEKLKKRIHWDKLCKRFQWTKLSGRLRWTNLREQFQWAKLKERFQCNK